MFAQSVVTNEIVLDALQFAARRYLSPHLLACTRPEVWVEAETSELVMSLRADLYGKQTTVEHWWWASWWDCTKARWFPKWALRRWPPHVVTSVVKVSELFPELGPVRARHEVLHTWEHCYD